MTSIQNKFKFKEGENYLFKLTGITEIPGTGEPFFILENQFGGKQLLKAIHYLHYNMKVGDDIDCRIDKINCSGKIFLEPENPFYKQGETYEFEVLRILEQINSVGENEKVVIVKDSFGHENSCSLPDNISPSQISQKIKCKVVRIKKGVLYLIHPEMESTKKLLQVGKIYSFTVKEIKKLDGIDYYILNDDFNNSYSLKVDMYKQYNLCIGRQVNCTVTKFNTDGHLKIEPEHPHYKVGKTYAFKFLRIEDDTDPLNKNSKIITVLDVYGIETRISAYNPEILNKPIPEYLHCKVEGVRKGKVILNCE